MTHGEARLPRGSGGPSFSERKSGATLFGTILQSLLGGTLILVGILGLVLPVVPGLLLIAFGAVLLARLLRRKSPNT